MALSSLNRGLSVMEYIAVHGCASVSEIAQAFEIDKSTASRILATLTQHNLLYKEERSMKYYTSEGTLLYSCRTMSDYLILDEIHPILRQLAEQLTLTAQICILRGDCVLVIDQVKSEWNRYLREPVMPGMTEPLHCSAIGKCILAYMPKEWSQQIMKKLSYPIYTERTISSPELLQKELEQIRQDGYAKDMGELSDYIYCLAVPIFDESGNVSFSIGISGEQELYENRELFAKSLQALKKSAKEIGEIYIEHRAKGGTL